MIETCMILALVVFCVISGFLLATFQQVLGILGKMEISFDRMRREMESADHQLGLINSALSKPVDIDHYKPAGAYDIQDDGRLNALVDEAKQRLEGGSRGTPQMIL